MSSIRAIRSDDFHALAELFARNDDAETRRQFNPFPLDSNAARSIARHKGKDEYFVSIVDGQFAAFAMLRGWDEGFEIPSFGILVDRDHRGRGLARELLTHAIDRACKNGCSSVRLSVFLSNSSALRLYESFGFSVVAVSSVMVAGETDSKLVMTKAL